MGESALAGDEAIVKACVKTVMPASDRIAQDVDKGFHIGKLFEVAEELSQEETDRIVSRCEDGIPVCHNGADEREIDQG